MFKGMERNSGTQHTRTWLEEDRAAQPKEAEVLAGSGEQLWLWARPGQKVHTMFYNIVIHC